MFKPYHRSFLKVKIKSLAAESRIIRLEEKKSFVPEQRNGLYLHRTWDVRQESRAAQLAYAYLRGKDLAQVEPKAKDGCRQRRAYRRAAEIVKKFGTQEAFNNFESWIFSDVKQ